jgi:hypothetical protein
MYTPSQFLYFKVLYRERGTERKEKRERKKTVGRKTLTNHYVV